MYDIKIAIKKGKIRRFLDHLHEHQKEESVRQIKQLTETSMTPSGTGCNSHSCVSDT